jgi:hypothetical protein
MDPNRNLQEQEEMLRYRQLQAGGRAHTRAELAYLRTYLSEWLAHGGFEPDWGACPLAATYYERLIGRRKRGL